MIRARPLLMIAPLALTLLLVSCSVFGPSPQEIPNRAVTAAPEASPSGSADPLTMTAGAANLTTQPAGTASVTPSDPERQVTGTAHALATGTRDAIATSTAGPSLAEVDAPESWNLILYEPFATNENLWPVGADDSQPAVHQEHTVIGGQYLVTVKAEQGFSSYSFPQMPNVLDFYVSVDGRLESGEPATQYGLAVNVDRQTGDFYAFLIDEGGLWAVSLRKGGSWFPINGGRSSQIVHGGNHLAVKCAQNNYTFYVNHQEIAQAHDDRLGAPGKLGIFVEENFSGEATIAFDNFTVLTP